MGKGERKGEEERVASSTPTLMYVHRSGVWETAGTLVYIRFPIRRFLFPMVKVVTRQLATLSSSSFQLLLFLIAAEKRTYKKKKKCVRRSGTKFYADHTGKTQRMMGNRFSKI